MENKLGKLKQADYRAKQTKEQGREVNTKKLSQKIKQKRAQPTRYNYPASRENIESLKSSPLTLGPGVFSNARKKNINTKKYYTDYTAKGCQLCGQYYRKQDGTYVHVDRNTH